MRRLSADRSRSGRVKWEFKRRRRTKRLIRFGEATTGRVGHDPGAGRRREVLRTRVVPGFNLGRDEKRRRVSRRPAPTADEGDRARRLVSARQSMSAAVACGDMTVRRRAEGRIDEKQKQDDACDGKEMVSEPRPSTRFAHVRLHPRLPLDHRFNQGTAESH